MIKTTFETSTHHVFESHTVGAGGKRSGPTEHRVHFSRKCQNCAHFAVNATDDWDVQKDGPCLNGLFFDSSDAFCHNHQSEPEWQAGSRRVDRPVFALVKGGLPR